MSGCWLTLAKSSAVVPLNIEKEGGDFVYCGLLAVGV
jgi:hypothetical protein